MLFVVTPILLSTVQVESTINRFPLTLTRFPLYSTSTTTSSTTSPRFTLTRPPTYTYTYFTTSYPVTYTPPPTYYTAVTSLLYSPTKPPLATISIPPPDFELSASPDTLTVFQDSSATSTIYLDPIGTFPAPVTISYFGGYGWVGTMPAGVLVTCPAVPPGNYVIPPAGWLLQVTAYDFAQLGTFTYRIEGTCGTLKHHVDLSITIKPLYNLHVHAILTALDNGGEPASDTAQSIQDALSFANQVYTAAGIRFIFNPASDMEKVSRTDLKQDYPPGFSAQNPENPPAKTRQEYAKKYPGKLVIYYRVWHDPKIDPDYSAPSYSSGIAESVVLASPSDTNTFAHEVGHYFGLTHTFSAYHGAIENIIFYSDPPTNKIIDYTKTRSERLEYVKSVIKDAVEKYVVSKEDALKIFDGDLKSEVKDNGNVLWWYEVKDTPPNPADALFDPLLWGGISPASIPLDVTFKDSTTQHYVLQPDKGNIMSYFFREPDSVTGPKHISNDQANVVRDMLENKNRNHLISSP